MSSEKNDQQEEIMDAALEVVEEEGIRNTTTERVANRAEISQGIIGKYFQSSKALLIATIKYVARGVFSTIAPAWRENIPGDEQLKRLIRLQLSFIAKNKGVPRLLFSERLHLEDPDLNRSVRAMLEAYTEQVTKIIDKGKSQGRFRTEMPSEEAAYMVAALVQGVVLQWSLHNFKYPLNQQSEAIWGMIAAALGAREKEQQDERDSNQR